MFKALKKFHEILKKEAEITKAQRRLARVDMDYIYLQQIADTVSSGYNVEITIKMKDGGEMIIKRSTPQDQVAFKSFAERFNDYQNGVNK